jgi:tryptophan synthase alpha chain
MSRIGPCFEALRQGGRRALVMYLTVGHPQRESALDLVPAVVEGGADMIELGVPFSDPLADGATVQRATQQALRNGVNVAYCIQTVRTLRERGIVVPIVFMGYYNPMLQYGLERFCADAQAAGVDGLIVPDLPPEESHDLHAACARHDIDLIYFLAPTSTDERMREVAERASGFIYCVSLTGTTGAREVVASQLPDFLHRARAATDVPLAVGFGITEPQHAEAVAQVADGVIVGSALLNVVERAAESGTDEVRAFVAAMREGTDRAERKS